MLHGSPTATTDMAVLLSELWALRAGSRESSGVGPLRCTVQVRLGLEFGFGISDIGFLTTIDEVELNSADFAICFLLLKSFSANFYLHCKIRIPQSSTRLPAHLRGLVTPIHEASELSKKRATGNCPVALMTRWYHIYLLSFSAHWHSCGRSSNLFFSYKPGSIWFFV